MKFIVDAQLPVRLARFIKTLGYDTIHTRDLPRENATPDNEINTVSIQQNRILITKDVDFVNSFLTVQQPYKLLLITTGNINNSELESLFIANFQSIVELFKQHSYSGSHSDAVQHYITRCRGTAVPCPYGCTSRKREPLYIEISRDTIIVHQ